eukprot:symbB.v1.2.025933.t1/scaffold2548.1/size76533/3
MTTAGPPTSFSPAAPSAARRARSNVNVASRRPVTEEASTVATPWLDPVDVVPYGGKRWLVKESISSKVRKEVRQLRQRAPRKPLENHFSGWQMPFPFELPCGESCPICTLGECGDVNCPAYRPKHPEIREAVEETVLRHCMQSFSDGIGTYVSVGAGLLAQDWIILEKLRSVAAELQPSRVVFVELRTAEPVMACEGRKFSIDDGGLDLCQLGYHSEVGPEFSFSAVINFECDCTESRLFDFCNGVEEDNIYVEVVSGFGDASDVGGLIFGVRRGSEDAQVAAGGAWIPGQPHLYLFTVSAKNDSILVNLQILRPFSMERCEKSKSGIIAWTLQMSRVSTWMKPPEL